MTLEDLVWVDWSRIKIRDNLIRFILFGFKIPFKDLPKHIHSNETFREIVQYRLEVGR